MRTYALMRLRRLASRLTYTGLVSSQVPASHEPLTFRNSTRQDDTRYVRRVNVDPVPTSVLHVQGYVRLC